MLAFCVEHDNAPALFIDGHVLDRYELLRAGAVISDFPDERTVLSEQVNGPGRFFVDHHQKTVRRNEFVHLADQTGCIGCQGMYERVSTISDILIFPSVNENSIRGRSAAFSFLPVRPQKITAAVRVKKMMRKVVF